MKTKICFKCNKEKDIDDFYKHKEMLDGHLNKCKECTKEDVNIRYKNLIETNPDFVEKEKIRAREKYFRLEYKEKYKQSSDYKRIVIKRYREKFPEKTKAYNMVNKKYKAKNGYNNHHWSYREEHWLDFIELTTKEHYKLHRYIVYDQERCMYRRCDNNELLDTKDKHIEYYNSLIDKP